MFINASLPFNQTIRTALSRQAGVLINLLANSVDPDQLQADLDLPCLSTGVFKRGLTRDLKLFISEKANPFQECFVKFDDFN